jgi:DNA-binding FadR family transcriptional regulator
MIVPNNVGSAAMAVAGRVFTRLSEEILSGRYEAGEKLPTQRTLAAELGVNMTSLREALKRLEQLGLVEVRHGDAMRVTDWRARGGLDVIAHVLFAAGGLDRGVLADVMEARRLMLAEAAALAAERRDEDQAARLLELAAKLAAAPGADAAQALDWAFFNELVEAARNIVLLLVMNSIRGIYLERGELFLPVVAEPAELAPLYERAAVAIARRQGPAARRSIEDLAARQQRLLMESLP